MSVLLTDFHLPPDVVSGQRFSDASSLIAVLERFTRRKPEFFELKSETGYTLMIGVASERFCVQHSSVDGDPPYLVAVGFPAIEAEKVVDFMMQGSLTEVPAHLTVTKEDATKIAIHFMETGERLMNVTWEAI